MRTINVEFKKNGKQYVFLDNNLDINEEDYVVVNTERGLQFGKVVSIIGPADANSNHATVYKIATKDDERQNERNIKEAEQATKKAQELAKVINATASTNEDVARNSQYLMLGVKPQVLPSLIDEIREFVSQETILVTMAAGIKMATLEQQLNKQDIKVIRIMPNTPVAIGEGVVLASKNANVSDDEFNKFIEDFKDAGMIVPVDENLIDAGSVVMGCGPAYIYMYIDALAKAGESLGLDYDLAAKLAKATTIGSAKLSSVSDESLESLRIKVCSPGGSTIEGVHVLEDQNLDKLVLDALTAAYKRTKELAGE